MSKHRPYLLSLVLFLAFASARGQAYAADSVAVAHAHESWFRGLLAHDTTTLSAVLAPDITLGFPAGNVMPRQDFLRYKQDGQLFYDSAEHHELRIRVYPAAALVTGRSTLTYRFKGTAGSERLAYTATYIRFNGAWRMVAWQSTIVPAPKPPSSSMRSNDR